ncbi:MAG: hypothetical protein ACOYBU_04785 [Dermatophilaceae bacterium]
MLAAPPMASHRCSIGSSAAASGAAGAALLVGVAGDAAREPELAGLLVLAVVVDGVVTD